jgi:hypothetical protein
MMLDPARHDVCFNTDLVMRADCQVPKQHTEKTSEQNQKSGGQSFSQEGR